MLQPHQCPRFDSCSSPLCPLDSEWHKRKMLRDERICYYIRTFAATDTLDDVDKEIALAVKEMMVNASLNAALDRALGRLG